MARILLVDDELPVTMALKANIETNLPDNEVYTADSVEKALELLNGHSFDVVVTDICMPRRSGFELLQEIRRLWPMCYVIMLTAYSEFDYAYKSSHYENVTMLLKLEEPEVILSTIQTAIDAVEARYRSMETERAQRRSLENVKAALKKTMLDRLLKYGGELPDEKQRADCGVCLHPEKDILLAGIDAEEPMERQQATEAFEELLAARALNVTAYPYGEKRFYLIQNDSELTDKAMAHCVYEDMDRLAGRFAGAKCAVLAKFVPWSRIHTEWNRLRYALRAELESGKVLVIEKTASAGVYPASDDLEHLSHCIEERNAAAFCMEIREAVHCGAALNTPRLFAFLTMLLEERYPSAYQYAEEHFERSLAAIQENERQEEQALLELQRYLDGLFREVDEDRVKHQNEMIQEINAYIERHLMEPLTLSSIADHFHYNSSYLSRVYKGNAGEGLNEHILRVRIERARRMIDTSDASLSVVAEQCGFQTAKYFSVAFKKVMGMSPSAYKHR